MSQLVRAIVKIEGVAYPYLKLMLSQKADWHHQFEIKANLSTFGETLQGLAKELIGKAVQINLQYTSEADFRDFNLGNSNQFDAIVKGLSLNRSRGNAQIVSIRGEGLSCLLDDGEHTRSFTEQSLQQIADTILSEYDDLFPEENNKPLIDFKSQDPIPYLVQYKESNYQFLLRIAAEYNEWMYYDGKKLVLGKPEETENVLLSFGEEDFDGFDLGLHTAPVSVRFKGYNFLEHEFPECESTHDLTLANYASIVHDKSQYDIYGKSKEHLVPVIRSMDKDQLQKIANRRHGMRVHEMVRLKGSSRNPDLQIGTPVEISDDSGEDFGVYVILSIQHHLDSKSRYINYFEAVPQENHAPPIGSHVGPPFCETQVAEVVETNDPGKLGRVRVQFIWQQGTDEKSPWIRLATPSAGGDKGFFLVPEIGDFVLVDFEHHDPDNPYVLSGFYHGKAKPGWQDDENNIKAWVTRSGHQILLNDKGGEESILISNPEGKNSITLSLGEKPSVSVQSAGSVSINGTESISISSKSVSISGSTSVTINGNTVYVKGSDTCKIEGANKLDLLSDTDTLLKAPKVGITGETETKITGGVIKLNS